MSPWGRRLKEQQELAAAVIQRCYRKYKQFALFQRMTQAAILIQSKFRSYAEQKRFQRRRRAAVLIQQRFRSLRQHRSTFLTLKQDQAARKIMRFLRRCRHRGWGHGQGFVLMLLPQELAAQQEEAELERGAAPPGPPNDYKDKYRHLIGSDAAKAAARTMEANKAYGCVPVANKRDTRSIEEAMNEIRAKKRLRQAEDEGGAGGGPGGPSA
ncbi:PREDICTED: sperm-associated antigen 7 [Lepidothrix coronata]|uniref:Sperm-associated antigen 7 n=1 Tax=Lepidothrix coronata TaxID=321398 RepID=A0A6J0JAA4_9PASS|nr:PREDICTED: sperm-associated antigen 7 [Lepidothrix coronata]